MSLVRYEWRKLFLLPALWVFLALSLLFNALLICTLSEWDRAFFNDASADAALLGQQVDEPFLKFLCPRTEVQKPFPADAEIGVIVLLRRLVDVE